MNISVIPKDNPSYETTKEADDSQSAGSVLDVYDVLLAGVEADD